MQTYLLLEELGRGSFGIVRKCRRRRCQRQHHNKEEPEEPEPEEDRALKTILKSKVDDPNTLRDEINILLTLDHPNIIKLYEVYEDDEHVYLVTELCTGGELYDRVVQKMRNQQGTFTEIDAARILRSIIDGIAYCHTKGIVHRDLKPENFLFQNTTDTSTIKIIDFGLAGRFEKTDHHHHNPLLHEEVGTIYYVAPEVLSGKYSEKCDLWSIGVTAYVLLCGFAPFNAGSEADTYLLVEKGIVQYPSPAWDKVSKEALQFVQALLQINVEQRLSAQQALEHPWLNHESIFQKRMKQLTNKFLNLTTTTTMTTTTSISSTMSDSDNSNTGSDNDDDDNDNNNSGSSEASTQQRRPRSKNTSMNDTDIVYNDLKRSQQYNKCYQDYRNKKKSITYG